MGDIDAIAVAASTLSPLIIPAFDEPEAERRPAAGFRGRGAAIWAQQLRRSPQPLRGPGPADER